MNKERGWKFHSGYKRWEGAHGHGKYAVQKMKHGGWVLMSVPCFGNPEVIASYPSKEIAMKEAEKLSGL